MSYLHVTHNDLDGIGCILVAEYFELKSDYLIINYGEEFVETAEGLKIGLPSDYDGIIVTDFSPVQEMYDFLKENYQDRYKVFDHHVSTEQFSQDPDIFFDIKKSGAKIFFDFLREGRRVPSMLVEMINLISIYDLYDTENSQWEKAMNLNRLFYKNLIYYEEGVSKYMPFIHFQLNKISRSKQSEFFYTDKEWREINEVIEYEQKQFNLAKSVIKFRIDNKGFKYGIFHAPTKISYVSKLLLDEYQDIDYIICLNSYKTNINGKIHLRIRDSSVLKVSDFPDNFKGHEKAGGGSIEIRECVKAWSDRYKFVNHYKD